MNAAIVLPPSGPGRHDISGAKPVAPPDGARRRGETMLWDVRQSFNGPKGAVKVLSTRPQEFSATGETGECGPPLSSGCRAPETDLPPEGRTAAMPHKAHLWPGGRKGCWVMRGSTSRLESATIFATSRMRLAFSVTTPSMMVWTMPRLRYIDPSSAIRMAPNE